MKFISAIAVIAAGTSANLLPRDGHSRGHQLSKRGQSVNGSYIDTKAPFENIFSDITIEEGRSVISFLRKQSNVTM
jgi:hypothetical protein